MQYVPVDKLYALAGTFRSVSEQCARLMETEGKGVGKYQIDETHRAVFLSAFQAFAEHQEFRVMVPFAIPILQRIVEHLKKPGCSGWQLTELVRDFERRIEDQLSGQVYFLIGSNEVRFVTKPLDRWESVVARYPETEQDIIQAGWCLAFIRSTAAVFHLMRVLEHGLRGFAAEVGVGANTELENWKNIIDQIEKEMRSVEALPKSQDKSAKLQRYSELASQFRFFKDAWRNHVSHARSSYDQHQALSVYTHVHEFMLKVASGDPASSGLAGDVVPP